TAAAIPHRDAVLRHQVLQFLLDLGTILIVSRRLHFLAEFLHLGAIGLAHIREASATLATTLLSVAATARCRIAATCRCATLAAEPSRSIAAALIASLATLS